MNNYLKKHDNDLYEKLVKLRPFLIKELTQVFRGNIYVPASAEDKAKQEMIEQREKELLKKPF